MTGLRISKALALEWRHLEIDDHPSLARGVRVLDGQRSWFYSQFRGVHQGSGGVA
jgi:hypothetical protein